MTSLKMYFCTRVTDKKHAESLVNGVTHQALCGLTLLSSSPSPMLHVRQGVIMPLNCVTVRLFASFHAHPDCVVTTSWAAECALPLPSFI